MAEDPQNEKPGRVARLVGEVRWTPPRWFTASRATASRGASTAAGWVRAHKPVAVGSLVAVALVAFGAQRAWQWHQSRPQPVRISVTALAPNATPYVTGETPRPHPLRIEFGGSVAPLDRIDKPVPSGVTLAPEHPGRWVWQTDASLVFTPEEDWPIGETFKVRLGRELFAPHVTLETYEPSFSTAAFTAQLSNLQLHQDPRNPKIKRIEATVSFSHPVDTDAFPRSVSLRKPRAGAALFGRSYEPLPFTVTYDKFKTQAFIHSEPLPIPLEDLTVGLQVDAGAKPAARGRGLAQPLEGSVRVPGMYSYFNVASAELTLVRNERFEPEHLLVLQLSDGVSEADLHQHLSVWVLPRDLPAAPGRDAQRNYPWSDPTVIGADVLAQSTRLPLTALPTQHEHASLHSFKFTADAHRALYVRLNKGLQSEGGYVLASEHNRVLYVPPLPMEVSILHNGALLSLAGEKKVSVMTRDLPAIRFEIGRVLASQINHLVSQTGGHFAHPEFSNYLFNEDNLVERSYEVRSLEAAGKGKAQYAAYDFAPLLGEGDATRRGLFFFAVAGWDRARNYAIGPRDSRLILVTDLGLLVKDSADGSHDVFVQSISRGEPAEGAEVSVLGKNGIAVLRQTTDAEGRARFPSLRDFQREQQPVAWLVKRGEDLAFLPMHRGDRQLNFTRFDVGGVHGASSPERLSAYLFSDRGLYRPTDRFHVAAIVKPSDWNQSIAGLPLELAVTDPRGLEIHRKKLSMPASGFVEMDYTTEETSPTGAYQVNFYTVNDGRRSALLGSTSVRVEEFLPDRMKITTRFSTERLEGWVNPAGLQGQVSLKNLFGIPAANRRVSAEVVLSPAAPSFRAYRDYRFHDPLRATQTFTERLGDVQTDDAGEATLPLNLERFEKGTYRVSLLAEGYELEGGRGVLAEASVLVSPLPYLVGYKADGTLTYIDKDSQRSLELVAIDPSLQKVAAKELKAQLYELRWVSVLTRQPNGTYQYQSVQKELPVRRDPLPIAAAGTVWKVPTDQPGDFALSIRDATDLELLRVRFTVAGRANLDRALERNAELELKLSRREYAPGEEIELQIKAPYVGAGLLTIERDRVYAHRWFRTDTTASIQRITVPADVEGNGYVNVAFVRSTGSPEVFMSPLSYAVAPFTVNHEARLNRVTLEAPELARPGEPLKITYSGQRAGKAIVFAVDEGILQVAAYASPDPIAHFFKKRALEVQTAQIVDLLLPEFSLTRAASSGGDAEGAAAVAKNLNPFKRKRDKPAVFWSGIVDVDATPRQLVYQVPDSFNGALRLMAVAVSPQAVGAASRRAVIRGPFVLSPNVPTFVAPGDEVEVSVGVANGVEGSGADAPIELELKTSDHLEVLDGGGRHTVKVSEGREGSATFKLRARSTPGSARLTFTARWKDQRARQAIELSVRPATPYLTTVTTGRLESGARQVAVPRRMHAEHRTLEATAATVPLGMARGLMAYLGRSSYGSTEELVSRAFPLLVLQRRKEFALDAKAARQSFEQAIRVLRTRQNDEGAFGFWAANSYVSDQQTAYVAHFLTEARERGEPVPPELLGRALEALRAIAGKPVTGPHSARDRAYALYVLARNNAATGAQLAAFRGELDAKLPQSWAKDLIGAHLAGAYRLVRQDRQAASTFSLLGFGLGTPDHARLHDGLTQDAGTLYVIARHFPERLPSISAAALKAISDPISAGSFNTYSAATAILALDAYATALEGGAEPATLPIQLAEVVAGKGRPLQLSRGLFPAVPFSPDATSVEWRNDSELPLFFQVTQAGFDLEPPKAELKERLEVYRELRTLDGKTVTEVPLGAEVEVRLKLRSLAAATLHHVAISDLLPGGFEVVLDRPHAPSEEHAEAGGEEQPGEEEVDEQGDYEEGSVEEPPGEEDRGPTTDAVPAGHGYVPPIGAERSTFQAQHVDVREDRVLVVGSVSEQATEFVYRIKAVNKGQFAFPPAFAEGIYDRSARARSAAATVKVTGP